MDPDRLRSEAEEWVEEGLISQEQAEAIVARYDEAGRSRLTLAIALVGAALVGVGLVIFLAANWENLGRGTRTAILVATPLASYAAGWWLVVDRGRDRVGRALVVLGAVFVGVSLFSLAEIHAPWLDDEWLLLAWAAVALPSGHALGSRLTALFGLGVVGALVAVLAEPADPVLPVGALGVTLYGVGIARRNRPLAGAYRIGGTALAVGALLAIAGREGRYGFFAVEPNAVLAATVLGALAAVAAGGRVIRRDRSRWLDAAWPGIALAALLVAGLLAHASPEPVPELLAFAGVHALVLALVLATVAAGYRTRSPALVNLAALALFVQLLLVSAATIPDVGPLALVAVGLALLGIALGLERGRRLLLDGMAET